MSGLIRAAAVARKDLLLEWRGRESLIAMSTFALLVLLLLGFTIGATRESAPTMLWVALGLATMLGISRLVYAEVEQEAFEVLLLYPGSREHLFWGKWAALAALLAVLWGILLVLAGVLFNLDVWLRLPALIGVGVLGVIGLSATGTLFAALLLHVRGRELLLPLLLLPVMLPVVLAGVRITEAALGGGSAGIWVAVVGVFDILCLLVVPLLFEAITEEA
ncbi:MAG: heme exporter protein CcmB [Armatimonadetes bacterium]|nr:heme exporter protein CcmB [Armatimonadota bacterium]MBI2247516.1 heme exporter protein CcmB [Armatimonadota bacterium]